MPFKSPNIAIYYAKSQTGFTRISSFAVFVSIFLSTVLLAELPTRGQDNGGNDAPGFKNPSILSIGKSKEPKVINVEGSPIDEGSYRPGLIETPFLAGGVLFLPSISKTSINSSSRRKILFVDDCSPLKQDKQQASVVAPVVRANPFEINGLTLASSLETVKATHDLKLLEGTPADLIVTPCLDRENFIVAGRVPREVRCYFVRADRRFQLYEVVVTFNSGDEDQILEALVQKYGEPQSREIETMYGGSGVRDKWKNEVSSFEFYNISSKGGSCSLILMLTSLEL